MASEVTLKVAMACEVGRSRSEWAALPPAPARAWLAQRGGQGLLARGQPPLPRTLPRNRLPTRRPRRQGCVGAVKRVLGKAEGVQSVDVDLGAQKVTVTGSNLDAEALRDKVAKTGKATEVLS